MLTVFVMNMQGIQEDKQPRHASCHAADMCRDVRTARHGQREMWLSKAWPMRDNAPHNSGAVGCLQQLCLFCLWSNKHRAACVTQLVCSGGGGARPRRPELASDQHCTFTFCSLCAIKPTCLSPLQEQFNSILEAAAAAELLDAAAAAELRTLAQTPGAERPVSSASATSNGPAASAANGTALGGAGVPAFKLATASALKEFFNSADTQEVAARWGGRAENA